MRWWWRRLIRLYPRSFRGRYGDELSDLLAASDCPGRDALDLLVHAAVVHLEVPMSRPIRTATGAVATVMLVFCGLALGELRDGVVEVPQHWWSALAAIGAATSVGVSAVVHRRPLRQR